MKKLIITILAMIMLIWVFPISASAEETISAPKTVQYKIINHDKVALRWSKVEGADMYYIYLYNTETGKYKKEGEVKTTSCKITELEANTKYTYAISAVKSTDSGVVKSKVRKINFTTPDEWIYYNNSSGKYKTYRKHYDGSDDQEFDVTAIENDLKKVYSDVYQWGILVYNQYCGYVYFKVYSLNASTPERYYIYRMKNDGSGLEDYWYIYRYEYFVFTDAQNVYKVSNENLRSWSSGDYDSYYIEELFNNYKKRPDDLWFYDDLISSIYTNPNNNEIISDKVCSFRGPVSDGKYIYIFSEPLYNLTDKTSTLIYRAKYDGSDMQKIGELKYNKSFIFGDGNNGSTNLFGCDDNYLYYSVCGRDENETKNSYTYYRISLKDKNLTPQKLISAKYEYIAELEICNGYLYFSVWDKPELYCRMKLDGTGLTKSDKPFEWRY